jgi:hypothetical protein
MALPARLPFSPFALVAATLVTGGAAAAGCILDWTNDCGRDLGYPNCHGQLATITGGNTGSGGTGSSSSGGGDAGDAGEGGVTGCTNAGSCPLPPGPCAALGTATCTNGVCGVKYTPGPAPSQVYGNCQQNVCDAMGVMTSVDDNTNVLVNGTCNTYTCINGTLQPTGAQKTGTTCTMKDGTMGYCAQNPDPDNNGIFTCVPCNTITQMPCNTVPTAPFCVDGYCVSTGCKNPDVACGGTNCVPCADGKTCSTNADCFSGYCPAASLVCQPPSCSDNTKNETETDIDCGGGKCPSCPTGRTCLLPTDCKSGVCGPPSPPGQQATCQAPTCTDGVKNGGETGIDCGSSDGGAGCPPCGDGG